MKIKRLNEILKLLNEDQKVIILYTTGNISLDEWKEKSDSISKEFLSIINSHGFPYRNNNSEDIYKGAITLSLHLDLSELNHVYSKYIEKATNEQIHPDHKIIFIDKIRILSGLPQIYGSQYRKNSYGKIELLPVENINEVDTKRKEIGAKTLSEYRDSIQ